MVNHYDVLGVSRDSGLEEIKQAYHRLAMEYHPDKNPSPRAAETMKQINEAYRILSDPALRDDYDKRFSHASGGNVYSRWYRPQTDGFGRGAPPVWNNPTPGYEAPRPTVSYESVTLFSFEHIMAAGIVGLAFGIALTAAFVFFGIDVGAGYGLGMLVIFAMIAATLPPFVTVLMLRNTLNAKSEAGLCGSISLAAALPLTVLAGSYARITGDPLLNCCCLLPFISLLAGWVIGGFVGKMSWDIFRS
ncbi:MAG: chaperone protein DnaJ [Methanocella sp. PtaU1.Bin125]|nr:MAG: chaperone protein DnaJ [Methanocella sp. PtaU1.Bin125]